jgi:hypothetical protein
MKPMNNLQQNSLTLLLLIISAVFFLQPARAWWANGHLISKQEPCNTKFSILVARIAYDMLD